MARWPTGTMRSFLPLPWRTWSVRRSVWRSASSRRQSSVRRNPSSKRVRAWPGRARPAGRPRSGTARSRSTSAEREHFLRQPFFHARQFQLAGRVVQDDVLPGEPAKEVFEDAQPVALGAPAKPLAVGLLITPEPALEVFQDGPGDLARLLQIAFGGPERNILRALRRPSRVPGE